METCYQTEFRESPLEIIRNTRNIRIVIQAVLLKHFHSQHYYFDLYDDLELVRLACNAIDQGYWGRYVCKFIFRNSQNPRIIARKKLLCKVPLKDWVLVLSKMVESEGRIGGHFKFERTGQKIYSYAGISDQYLWWGGDSLQGLIQQWQVKMQEKDRQKEDQSESCD